MRDPGEVITKTLVREFAEEALNMNVDEKFEKRLNDFFKNGTEIYKGYVDDPRNTGNFEAIQIFGASEISKIIFLSFSSSSTNDNTKR
jgi:hypothetical protein